jgi:hypothetical protein
MTMNQAAALRGKWKQQPDRTPCEHSNLELKWDERGYSTGHYACILCGESVTPRASIRVASLQVPAPSTARFPQHDC